MIEIGLLQEQQGEYVLDQPLPSLAIPTTLQASLMARLDRLAPVREVAQMGAVIGREFSYELVSAIAGMSDERLEDALNQLVQSELVFGRGEIPQAVYTFKHALVRDAAYASILKSRRAQVHASIANALEQRFEDITEAQPETLGLHLTEAGLPERAVHYWLRAGKVAALRSTNIEATAHLQRGIDCVSQLPKSAARDRLAEFCDFQIRSRAVPDRRHAGPLLLRPWRHTRVPASYASGLAIHRNTCPCCFGRQPQALFAASFPRRTNKSAPLYGWRKRGRTGRQ